MNKLLTTVAIGALAASPYVAAESDWSLSGNVTLATDYTFRGISQTDEKFALQGGFDAEHASGFYAGIWASNVDFGPANGDGSAQTELDYYIGYATDVAENVSVDVGVIHLTYPGEEAAFNYQEYVLGVSIYDIGLTLVYSDEYFGDGGPEAFVYNVDYSISLAESTSLDLHIGYTDTDADAGEELFFDDGVGEDSYVDYSVGVSHDLAGFTFGLAWVGTDLDGDISDDRVVFSVSRSM